MTPGPTVPATAAAWAAAPAPPVDTRGRRLLTCRRTRRGEVLLREAPLLLWGPDAQASALAAGGVELLEVGEAFGNWDALAAFLAFRQLPEEQQVLVRRLEGGDGAQATEAADVARAAAERLPAVLPALGGEDGLAAYAAVAGIVAANATENSDGRRALYDSLSMANHSCAPNAAWRTVNAAVGEKELVCIARTIPAAEEVCISYLPERDLFLLDHESRRGRLQDSRAFECMCDRCMAATQNGASPGEKELGELSTDLIEGGALRLMPTSRDEAVQQCKDIGRQLRRLDVLWPPASALKASLWSSFTDLLCACGAPQGLKEGAAQRALEESQPCIGARAWTELAQRLQDKIQPQMPSAPEGTVPPLPPEEAGDLKETETAEHVD